MSRLYIYYNKGFPSIEHVVDISAKRDRMFVKDAGGRPVQCGPESNVLEISTHKSRYHVATNFPDLKRLKENIAADLCDRVGALDAVEAMVGDPRPGDLKWPARGGLHVFGKDMKWHTFLRIESDGKVRHVYAHVDEYGETGYAEYMKRIAPDITESEN